MENQILKFNLGPLKDFLTSIQRLKLLSSDRSQETPPPATPPDPSCVGQYGMSRKKVHEVERMSEYLKSVFIRPLNIKQVRSCVHVCISVFIVCPWGISCVGV